jgi:hypothetical protein
LDNGTPIQLVRDERRIRLVLLSEDTRNSKYFWLTVKRNKNPQRTEFSNVLTLPVRLGPKDGNSQNCVHFDGASEEPCPLSALTLDQQISSEDRAMTKVYSLNFFGVRDPVGIVAASATTVVASPAGGEARATGTVAVEYDLNIRAGKSQ